MRLYFLLILAVIAFGCGSNPSNSNTPAVGKSPAANKTTAAAPVMSYEIVKTYPHDPEAFTQGLEYHNGVLYEGTGGKSGDDFYSSLRKVEIETGKVLQKYDLPREYFGEGITILGDKIYQVTWREQTAFVYDLNDFKLLREVRYQGQGWGLTNDGTNLIMSDGTHVLKVVEPESFRTLKTLVVLDESGRPLMDINELEFVNGEIWANVWQTGWIIRIDPQTGKLLGRIDLRDLADREIRATDDADVLNGIAYDEQADRIFITGKKWKRLFEIKVNPKQ